MPIAERGHSWARNSSWTIKPFEKNIPWCLEAFGMQTRWCRTGCEEAAALARAKESGRIYHLTMRTLCRNFVNEAQHGRIFVLNRDGAKESTGHSSPLPTLMHGVREEPVESEEMERTERPSLLLTENSHSGVSDVLSHYRYQQGQKKKFSDKHPFRKYFWRSRSRRLLKQLEDSYRNRHCELLQRFCGIISMPILMLRV